MTQGASARPAFNPLTPAARPPHSPLAPCAQKAARHFGQSPLAKRAGHAHIAAMADTSGLAPDKDTLARLAAQAIRNLPTKFAQHLGEIDLRVEDFPDDALLHAMGIADGWNLTGLYHGHPLGEQSIWSSGVMPPVITLFRLPLLMEWIETDVTLDALITHVLIHEVGHHFGLSDADMETLENAPEE